MFSTVRGRYLLVCAWGLWTIATGVLLFCFVLFWVAFGYFGLDWSALVFLLAHTGSISPDWRNPINQLHSPRLDIYLSINQQRRATEIDQQQPHPSIHLFITVQTNSNKQTNKQTNNNITPVPRAATARPALYPRPSPSLKPIITHLQLFAFPPARAGRDPRGGSGFGTCLSFFPLLLFLRVNGEIHCPWRYDLLGCSKRVRAGVRY